jgi:hypothetical protein
LETGRRLKTCPTKARGALRIRYARIRAVLRANRLHAHFGAAHPIAIAAVHGMDFLVTWNCVHTANAAIA